jgi:hypothetical protein
VSYEPPLIKLGRRQRPEWPEAIRKHAERIGAPLPEETGVVLSTRDAARKLQAEYGAIDTVVYLDVTDVEIASPSYFDQLLIFWPRAQLIGAVDPEVRVSFELAQNHRGERG